MEYGDTVTVLEKFVDGWWRCRHAHGQIGMVPYSVLMKPNKSASIPIAIGRRSVRGQSLKKKPTMRVQFGQEIRL